MAYTAPTPADIKTRFPEFASLDDARIQMFIDEAKRFVDESWSEEDYAVALRFLTAHTMTMEGVLNSGGSGPVGSGPLISESLGDASYSYAARAGQSGLSGSDADLASTPYGQRYLAIRRANIGGPIVV